MSERGNFRGGRGGRGGDRGGRGGSRGGHAGQQERPKKENILDLGKLMDKEISVKFNGGREGMCSPTGPASFVSSGEALLTINGQ